MSSHSSNRALHCNRSPLTAGGVNLIKIRKKKFVQKAKNSYHRRSLSHVYVLETNWMLKAIIENVTEARYEFFVARAKSVKATNNQTAKRPVNKISNKNNNSGNNNINNNFNINKFNTHQTNYEWQEKYPSKQQQINAVDLLVIAPALVTQH